jgi:hypothetical protein
MVDNIFSFASTVTSSTSLDLQIAQVGCLNIFERVFESAEIEDLHYLYNVRYLLKNSLINCRVSDSDPNDAPIEEYRFNHEIPTSSVRFGNDMMLKFDNINNYECFDGKSFLLDLDDRLGHYQHRMESPLTGITNPNFPHTINRVFQIVN